MFDSSPHHPMSSLSGIPQDTITGISYNKNILLSSWDGSLYMYSGMSLEMMRGIRTNKPILRNSFTSRIVTGDIFGGIMIYDASLNEIDSIETDVGGIQLLHEYRGRIVAGGWNKKISFIGDGKETLNTEGKIYCSDLNGDVLLVGQQECVVAYDLRTNTSFFRRRFNMPIRSVVLSKNGLFAGTTDGRIYHEDFSDETRSYVFNAHYSVCRNTKTFYPINSLVMNDHLFSGGSDGKVLRWSLNDKKTYKEIMNDKIGVSNLCMLDGRVAIGVSYCYDKGRIDSYETRVKIVDLL